MRMRVLKEATVTDQLKRFRIGSGSTQDVPNGLPMKADLKLEDEIDKLAEPDAERRLLYSPDSYMNHNTMLTLGSFITNLDEWTVLVLAATASYHEAQALRRGICNHLAFRASIDAVIPVSVEFSSSFLFLLCAFPQ
jgi:hypothetical protein